MQLILFTFWMNEWETKDLDVGDNCSQYKQNKCKQEILFMCSYNKTLTPVDSWKLGETFANKIFVIFAWHYATIGYKSCLHSRTVFFLFSERRMKIKNDLNRLTYCMNVVKICTTNDLLMKNEPIYNWDKCFILLKPLFVSFIHVLE